MTSPADEPWDEAPPDVEPVRRRPDLSLDRFDDLSQYRRADLHGPLEEQRPTWRRLLAMTLGALFVLALSGMCLLVIVSLAKLVWIIVRAMWGITSS